MHIVVLVDTKFHGVFFLEMLSAIYAKCRFPTVNYLPNNINVTCLLINEFSQKTIAIKETLWEKTNFQEVVSLHPSTRYWMEILSH